MRLLKKLYSIQSPSSYETKMIDFISRWCLKHELDFNVDIHGNISITKGKARQYTCLAAHLDEVHTHRPVDYTVVQHGNLIFGLSEQSHTTVGIGADDKNGIWIALKCLEHFKELKVVFFTEEEIGCHGSERFDMSFFDNCRFLIEADRRGSTDIIKQINGIELCSPEFLATINTWMPGYKPTTGCSTDLLTLKQRGLGISCVNVSCGYYNPHTNHEITDIAQLQYCLMVLKQVIAKCRKSFPHTPVIPEKKYFGYSGYRPFFGFDCQEIYYPPESLGRAKKTESSDNFSRKSQEDSQLLLSEKDFLD